MRRRGQADCKVRGWNLGANDRIADLFTDHALDLQRLAAGEARTVARFLRDLEADLVAQLVRVDPTGVGRQSARASRLARLLDQVRETIRQSYRKIGSTVRAELIELADIESAFVTRAINRGVGFGLATNNLTRNAAVSLVGDLLVQGAPVSDWWARQAGDALAKFTDTMRLGIAEGETNAQLVRRVRGGLQNGTPVQGVMEISRRNAESLVRSATQAAAGAARQATFEQNADIMDAVQWRSTLDTRTTMECAQRDGLRYTVTGHEPIGHSLPWGGGPGNLHWGCRSTSAPVTKSWRELGFDIDDLPPGTRASMDGQVAADTTFGGWLDRQSKTRQDEILGPGRAELYRSGAISFRDLVDGNGRELSTAQLRERASSPQQIMTPRDRPHFEQVLQRGRETNVEHLSGYDTETGASWVAVGGESHVGVSAAMQRELQRGDPRIVVHHNHPSSRSFSPLDLQMVGDLRGIRTLYAHGHDGSIYRADRVGAFSKEVLDAANNAVARPFIDLQEGFSSPDDRLDLFHHVVAIWMGRNGHIDYQHQLKGGTLAAYERNRELVDGIVAGFK